MKINHKLQSTNAEGQKIWMRVDDFAAELPQDAFRPVVWLNQDGGQIVYAYLIRTKVKKLSACQVLIIKTSPDDPGEKARFYIITRLSDSLEQVVQAMALRWTVETLFADFKERMGSDRELGEAQSPSTAFCRSNYSILGVGTMPVSISG